MYGPGETDFNEWIVRGEPDELRLRNDPVPTRLATCLQVINRIPDVIDAAPGFVTVGQLPRLRYRHRPLHCYLRGDREDAPRAARLTAPGQIER